MERLHMHKITRAYAITLTFFSLMSCAMPVVAKPATTVSKKPDNSGVQFVQQPEFPDNGTPVGRRQGAAGRGNCTVDQPLTALVPAFNKTLNEGQGKATYVWAKTVDEYPTFWYYLPYSPKSLRSIEFVLQDGEDDVYRTAVALPQRPGIVSFRLPSTAKPLEINKPYHWFFKINFNCDSQQLSDGKDYVEGWVQRVQLNPNLARQLKAASPQQRAALYAANGIWHEALTTLAALRLVDAEDATLKEDWTGLLQSTGLADIASKPIVQCCTLK